LHGEERRNGEQPGDDEGDSDQHAGALAEKGEAPLGLEGPVGDHGEQRQRAQKGDLIATHHHHGGYDSEQRRKKIRAAVERLFKQQKGEREEPVAEDHAGMLQAGGGRPP
jgi:hypothetical protein